MNRFIPNLLFLLGLVRGRSPALGYMDGNTAMS
jgi:hypothetical protein